MQEFYKEIPPQIACISRKCMIDLYARIRDDYRLFAAKGAFLNEEHALNLRNTKLFVRCADASSAEEILDNHTTEILTDPLISPKVKAEIGYALSVRSMRGVFQATNQRTITEVRKTATNIMRAILSDKGIMEEFIRMASFDHFTLQHSVKVGIFGTALAINLFGDELKNHRMEELSTAFFLHDIGMTKVPLNILDKEDHLSGSDWDVMKKHPLWGHDKLMRASYQNDETTSVVLYHHERCDGKGYPFKMSGDDIPVYAKICAIADTFESLTSARPFRAAKSPFQALRIMQTEMAREFDAGLFRAFVMLLGSG